MQALAFSVGKPGYSKSLPYHDPYWFTSLLFLNTTTTCWCIKRSNSTVGRKQRLVATIQGEPDDVTTATDHTSIFRIELSRSSIRGQHRQRSILSSPLLSL